MELQLSKTYTRLFFMKDSADHLSGKTGRTVTVTLSKAGGAFATAAGSVAEVANGWYSIALTTADTNTLGDLVIHCTATGADATDFVDEVTSLNFNDLNSTTVTVLAAVDGGKINCYRGVDWSIPLTVGNITGNTKLYFTVKKNLSDPDSSAIVQIERTAGLLVLNGSTSVTASDGSITVTNATTGAITIALKPASSSQLNPAKDLNYDVKALLSGTMTMMADGRSSFTIIGDSTRAFS